MTFATLTSEGYIPGTVALLNSLTANSKLDSFRMIVLFDGELSPASIDKLKRAKSDATLIRRSDLGAFEIRPEQSPKAQRLVASMQKLTLLNFTAEPLIYFLDSDMICVGDIRKCETFTHFTSPMVFGISLPGSVSGRPMFSGGSFIFAPSIDLYRELQEFALNYGGTFPLADQSILNAFFYRNGHADEVHLLGIEWEMLKRTAHHHPQVWKAVTEKKFIHFVGRKPWQTPQEAGYQELDRLWRKYA